MSKKNDNFFAEKKSWSAVKDELLSCYLKPYVQKILRTNKPLVYIDCFAGKGKFDDGQNGSPIIALNAILDCTNQTKAQNVRIETVFIDLYHAKDLQKNLKRYPGVKIVSGKYEDNITEILVDKACCNVFLYIDPYGIKALECSKFDEFTNGQFNSIELLINLNSFGFIREACRVMDTSFYDEELFDDLIEYDSSTFNKSEKAKLELNGIAGGDYWQQIIEDYKEHKIDGYEAEKVFSNKYCERLQQSYDYVLNMPLRIKQGQRPKYRMVHATNHNVGCLLMVDNMLNQWELLQDMQKKGQISFLKEDFDNQIITEECLEMRVEKYYSQFKSWISLNESMARFFVQHGVICSSKDIRNIVKCKGKEGYLMIRRVPEKTPTGRNSTFMEDKGHQKVFIRCVQ